MRISITQNITTKTHVNHAYTHTCNMQQDTAIEKPGARSALSREIADTNTHKQTTRTHMRVPMAHNQELHVRAPTHSCTDRQTTTTCNTTMLVPTHSGHMHRISTHTPSDTIGTANDGRVCGCVVRSASVSCSTTPPAIPEHCSNIRVMMCCASYRPQWFVP